MTSAKSLTSNKKDDSKQNSNISRFSVQIAFQRKTLIDLFALILSQKQDIEKLNSKITLLEKELKVPEKR